MRRLRKLQEYPAVLEFCYPWTQRLLFPFRRWLKPRSARESLVIHAEKALKGLIFDCRRCGQCALHSTGMTCPMTCPKNLRNGPGGGVRENGNCEVQPEKARVWLQAWERSKRMPHYGEMLRILPPLDQTRQGRSAWIEERSREMVAAGR